MVEIRSDSTGVAHYDSKKDIVFLPKASSYEHYEDYARDAVSLLVTATGHGQRLAREGMVTKNGKGSAEDATKQERLVAEVATAVKLQELGISAKLSPESMAMTDYWARELKENPCLIDAVESDVNNALDVIRKAEKGERMESAHERNKQQTEELREQEEGRPQVSVADALVLQDILRKGGMEINDRNFPGGQDDKREFLARFDGLRHYDTLTQDALTNARLQHEDPELVNIAYRSEERRVGKECRSRWSPYH